MVITCTTSKASNCVRSPLKSSSNGCGAHGHPPCSPRKNRSKFARTFENTARSLNKKTRTVVHQRISPLWSTGGGCFKSGSLGERVSKKRLGRSVRPGDYRWIHLLGS